MRNLSLICYHFWNKLNLSYLTQIKKQSSLLTDYDLLLHLRHFVNYYLFISVYVLTIHKMTLISNLTVSLVFGDKVNESFASIDAGLYCIYILFLWHGEITIAKIRTKRRPRTFVGVRYPSYRWGPRPMWPGTRDMKSFHSWDPKPRALKVGRYTQDICDMQNSRPKDPYQEPKTEAIINIFSSKTSDLTSGISKNSLIWCQNSRLEF